MPRRAARRRGLDLVAAVAELARIRGQLERMRTLCGEPDERLFVTKDGVSKWSPAEHVDHLLKVTSSVLERIPTGEVLPNGISFLGRVILGLGWIPRGVGKAPARVMAVRTTPAELHETLARVASLVEAVDATAVDGVRSPNVPHPRFGGLTPAQALRFVSVHNDHHLKIVRDILR